MMNIENLTTNDPSSDDMLILVDRCDHEIGSATKKEAHAKGLLHRAFSVVLVRDGIGGSEILLAKRSASKYHSGGLWANSCCSHPRTNENLLDAAYRRVREELTCEAVNLQETSAFAYRAEFDNGLCEHEYDHVLLGHCKGKISPNPMETSEVQWVSKDDLTETLMEHPEVFAAWAPMVLNIAIAKLE